MENALASGPKGCTFFGTVLGFRGVHSDEAHRAEFTGKRNTDRIPVYHPEDDRVFGMGGYRPEQ